MKINQAKAIAGIKAKLTGHEDYARAERDCVQQIIAARRAKNDNLAARLSEAKEVFKKRARRLNTCAVCSVTISRGATHCGIHSRPQNKMIAGDAGRQPAQKIKRAGNINSRVSVVSDPFAWEGYYTSEVQKVVKKWRGKISEQKIKSYFVPVARTIKKGQTSLNLTQIHPGDWPAIFELGLAANAIYANKEKLAYWLLTLPIHIAVNGHFPSYAEISTMIFKQGKKHFNPRTIQKQLERMRLVTAGDSKKEILNQLAKAVATRTT
jgi:hypothetical protein